MVRACFKEIIDGVVIWEVRLVKEMYVKWREDKKNRHLYVIESEMKFVSVEDVGERVENYGGWLIYWWIVGRGRAIKIWRVIFLIYMESFIVDSCINMFY